MYSYVMPLLINWMRPWYNPQNNFLHFKKQKIFLFPNFWVVFRFCYCFFPIIDVRCIDLIILWDILHHCISRRQINIETFSTLSPFIISTMLLPSEFERQDGSNGSVCMFIFMATCFPSFDVYGYYHCSLVQLFYRVLYPPVFPVVYCDLGICEGRLSAQCLVII